MRPLLLSLAKLRRLSGSDWRLLPEILVELARARILIAWIPFQRIVKRFGTLSSASGSVEALPSDERARRIGQLIRAVAPRLPWECKCLVQAIASKAVLKRRRIPCEVFIGVSAGREKPFAAHAWSRSGSVYVTGGRGSEGFTVLARFGETDDRTAESV